MEKLKVWHNTQCSKSREACSLLQTNGVEFEMFDYRRETLTEESLMDLLKKLNMKPQEIIRMKEPLFIEKFSSKKYTKKQWLKVLIKNPILIERPIVIHGERAVIARPMERINELIEIKN